MSVLNMTFSEVLATCAKLLLTVTVILPLNLILLCPCFACYLYAYVRARVRYGKEASVVSGQDVLYTLELPTCPSIAMALSVFEKPIDLHEFRHVVETEILKMGEKKESLVKLEMIRVKDFGYWLWIPPKMKFDSTHHVRILDDLMTESDVVIEGRSLMEILSDVIAKPFVPGRPEWEFLTIPRYFHEGTECSAFVFRIHHCYGDAMTVIPKLFSKLDPDFRFRTFKFPQRPLLEKIAWNVWALSYIPDIYLFPFTKEENPLRKARLSGEKTLAVSNKMELSVIKRIKSKTGAGVTEILLSTLAASLQEWTEPASTDFMTAVLAVPLITSDGPKIKNALGSLFTKLPTGQSLTPLERLVETKRQFRLQISRPLFYTSAYYTQSVFTFVPIALSASLVGNWAPATLMVSNVPMSDEQPYRPLGSKQISAAFWVPNLYNLGIGLGILGYCGTVRIGLTVDKAVVEDKAKVERLLRLFEQNLQNLVLALE